MKCVTLWLEDEQYNKLTAKKYEQKLTWIKFIMQLVDDGKV